MLTNKWRTIGWITYIPVIVAIILGVLIIIVSLGTGTPVVIALGILVSLPHYFVIDTIKKMSEKDPNHPKYSLWMYMYLYHKAIPEIII